MVSLLSTGVGSRDSRRKKITDNAGEKLLAFSVRDTGIGIAKDQVEQLFLPFSQVERSLSRRFGGLGIGLLLARRFAVALGGDVELSESTIGVGSHLTATIDPA